MPDFLGAHEPIWTFQEIADGVMSELEAYSRFVGSKPEARGCVKAHVLLPKELQEIFPCEEVVELEKWVSESVSNDGIIYLDELIEGVEGVDILGVPQKTVGIKRLQVVAEALARAGYGFVPDPRFDLRHPDLDDPLLLFKLGKSTDLPDRFIQGYPISLLGVAIGCYSVRPKTHIFQTSIRCNQSLLEIFTEEQRKLSKFDLEVSAKWSRSLQIEADLV